MRYIPDRKMYAAVMLAIKIGKGGAYSSARKGVRRASSYYGVEEDLIYPYIAEAMQDDARESGEYGLFYNDQNVTGKYGYWAVVCPVCGKISVVGDYLHEINAVRDNPCASCGFIGNRFAGGARND